jgi:hypothetical protein
MSIQVSCGCHLLETEGEELTLPMAKVRGFLG